MAKMGIDVSEHNGTLNWKSIKCDFALIRTGFGIGDEDGQLANNVKNCKLPYGFYHFSYAYTVERAKSEADFVVGLLKKHKAKPTLPVFFDWEYDSDRYAKDQGVTVDKELYSKMAAAFMDKIIAAGYESGNYYNHDYMVNYCNSSILKNKKYVQWYAYYGDSTTTKCDIWQYSESGSVTGFTGDINELRNEALLKAEKPAAKPKPPVKPKPVEKPKPAAPKPSVVNSQSRVFEKGKNIVNQPYGNGHSGVDLINDDSSDAICAHSDGSVIWCQSGIPNDQGSSGNRSYGNCVKLKHSGGYYTLYAHLDSLKVSDGQGVKQGTVIGMMGNTGNSYGKHLHFEVRNTDDSTVDPVSYINAILPGEKPSPTPAPGKYTVGTYRVDTEVLTVRRGPGTNYEYVPYGELTDNARSQINSIAGYEANGYVQGMICDVSEVRGAWGRTPSGWICLDFCKKA